jgi:type 1 fimbria pilin
MKKLFFIATIVFAMAIVSSVFGQTVKDVNLTINKQIIASGSKLKIKLIEIKDTRCPEDVNCVWEGNALIKFSLSKGNLAVKTFELNTGIDPMSISYQGFEIKIKDITPSRKSTESAKPVQQLVILTIGKTPKKP